MQERHAKEDAAADAVEQRQSCGEATTTTSAGFTLSDRHHGVDVFKCNTHILNSYIVIGCVHTTLYLTVSAGWSGRQFHCWFPTGYCITVPYPTLRVYLSFAEDLVLHDNCR